MSHYAKVRDGYVVDVIVADASFFATFQDTSPGTWKQTDPMTRHNQRIDELGNPTTGEPCRGNYAAIGFVYDYNNDVFYPPSPFPSWTLDSATWTWQPPVAKPVSDGSVIYDWDENNQTWVVSLEIPR